MAQGQLMFEVGIKEAVEGLDKVKKELDQFVTDYTKKMQIQVDIKNLETFINALKSIGNGEQLKPLLTQIERLQNRLASMTDKGQYFDMIRGEAEAAAAAVKIAEKNLENMKRTGNVNLISNARTNLEQAQQEAARTAAVLANATERFAKEEARAAATTNDTKQKIDALGESVANLHTKIGSGININLSGDFSKWANEVNSVTTAVRELVEQLQKMNTATSAQSATEATRAQTQAVLEESDAYKQLAKWREQAEKFHKEFGKTGNDIIGWHASGYIREPFTMHNGNGNAYTDIDVIKNHVYALKEESTLLKERQALMDKFSSVSDVGQKQRYNQILAVYNEVYDAMQKLKQEESKPATKGGVLDTQQFTALQEAITKIIGEINRLKEAFAGIGEITGISKLTDAINTLYHNVNNFKDVFSTLSSAVNLTPTSEYVKKLQTDLEAAQKTIGELTEKMTALAAAQNNVAESASKAGKSEKQIGDSQSALFNRYNKLLADIQNIKREIVEIQRSSGGGGPFGGQLGNYFSALNQIRNSVREITSAPSVADAVQRGMNTELLAKLNSALAALKTNFKEVVSDAKAFNKATDKGSSQAEARIRKLGMAFNELKNYMKANGGSEEMKRLQQEIQGAIRKMRDLMNAGRYGDAINVYERLSGIIRQAATATKDFERAQHSVSSTISHTNSQLMGQSQILSDLKTMAMQYLSVWGAQTFINNIIELGGQLEQQRLSIGAILQDTAQANHLFSQIKDLAIKSPFGVQQLDAMSKQLSAYGFQYSELYEWTKRLADISAATGTSVDRLALALGHVRSEGALSGYTLRQFSMGNIPLLAKLAENLGKTRQEIRKMTRNKEIGYEDVLNVLKQLTDEGGMFFEAQETMAQALNAKFKNLRDSFQIMYSEMAEGAPGDFLKGLATTLTDLSRQWQVLMPMIGAAGAMWAMSRVSAALVNVELAKMATLTNANTLASSKYSVAQLRQIANWEKMPHAMVRARLALQGFRTAMLSLGKMIFSWPTAIFAAIEALTYMWAKQSRESEKAKEMTEVLTNTALESQKNISKQLSNIAPYQEGMSDSAMKTSIESMTEAIKNYGVNAQAVLEKVYGKDAEGRVMSLADRYKTLREELEKTALVYKEMQRTSGGIEFGVDFSDGGWFDDDVQTDLTNYANALKDYENAFVSMTANYATAVNNALEQVKKASPEFKRIAEGLNSDAERVKWLYENQGQYGGIYNMFKGALHREDPNAGGGVLGYQLGNNLRNAEQEAMKELDQFLKGTEEWFKKFGYDFTQNGKNLSEVQVGNLLRQSREWLEKHPEWENIYDVIWDKLNKRWGLPIVPEVTEIEEELPKWLEDFQKELDKTGIKLTANMSMEQIVDEMKKAYDKAQTTINKLGPIALQAKVNVQGLTDEDVEKYNDPTSFLYNPELYNVLKSLKGANDAKTQVDTAAKKRGLKLEGMKKNGTHKADKQNQDNAKAVREQVRVIKEAADAFQYWREKVGDKGAWDHVQGEFGDVLKKIGITADNIEDVRGRLKEIPQRKEYKAIKDKKVKTEIDKEIAKDNDQFIRKDFERDTERFLSKTQIELDNLTRSWETFNSVREATGNVKLAIDLSGAQYAEGQTRNLADALKQKLESDFKSAGAAEIPFDINLSDEQIGDTIKAAIPKASEDQIKGLVEEYKKWRDMQRDVLRQDIDMFAKLVGGAKDYDTQIQLINKSLQLQIEANEQLVKNGVISRSDANKANNAATAQADYDKWKLTYQYSQLMNNSLALTRQELEDGIVVATEKLNLLMQANGISAKEYADEMMKITNLQKEWKSNALFGSNGRFAAGAKGGLSGLSAYYRRNQQKAAEEYARLKQKGASQEELRNVQNKYDKNERAAKKVEGLENVLSSMDALAKAMEPVVDLFDKLGMSDLGDILGAGTNAIQSASSMASGAVALFGESAGPYGAAIGAGLSIASSIFAMHDAAIQEEIDALKANVDALEANTEVIKAMRDRTLGYDTGELRKILGKEYSQYNTVSHVKLSNNTYDYEDNSKYGAAGLAMAEYYARNGNGSGYQQEYENLKNMRQDYIDMYNLENEKKEESQEALNEYKSQIAELDEQILFFIEDLAKDLYSIDFKSWADQISNALWTAFENGEDAAEAFHDTASDIIADVAKRMMNIHLIEPVFQALEEELFGKINENGQRENGKAFNYETGQFNEEETLRILGQFFGEDGEFAKVVTSAEDFYKMAEQVTGFNFGSGGSTSKKLIQGGFTESETGLLLSYVNGMRADLSINRSMIAQYFPMYYAAMTSGNSSLQNIDRNTAAIMRSNETIVGKITSLDDNIRGLKNNMWRVPTA